MRRLAVPALVLTAAFGVAACSADEGDFASEAEDFITDEDGDLAEAMGMTFSDAECEEPASTDTGETFTCTATGSDDQQYSFEAEITGDNEFSMAPGTPVGGGTSATTGGATATTGATTATT